MVMHHVHQHREAAGMTRLDQCFESIRPAVLAVIDGEKLGRVVAPTGARVAELGDRHDFHGVDPKTGQIIKVAGGAKKSAQPIGVESAGMNFVNNQIIQRGRGRAVALPIEDGRIIDNIVGAAAAPAAITQRARGSCFQKPPLLLM